MTPSIRPQRRSPRYWSAVGGFLMLSGTTWRDRYGNTHEGDVIVARLTHCTKATRLKLVTLLNTSSRQKE